MASRPIPFAHNSSHFVHIQNNLTSVLNDVKDIPGLAASVLWASCRLNRSKMEDAPVFCGWVEDNQAIKIRLQRGHPYAPSECRFGDTHPSKLFSDCLTKPAGEVVRRDWNVDKADPTSQRTGEEDYDEKYRRSIPIRVNNIYAGTLNVAFSGNPMDKDDDIKGVLVAWAQDQNSELVRYIKNNLDFAGPSVP